MSALAEVFRTHGAAYCVAGGDAVPARHRAVVDSITHCRTEALGTLTCSCDECGQVFDIYRSCGNRHCPVCGKAKGREWLAKQLDRLLPVPHFMITFTVPAAFRSLFLAHRKLCYQAFFQVSSAVLSRLGSESTYFPGDTPGFFGVLHTWGRNLSYHPHIHYIVPAGAFDSPTHRWHDCPTAFYAPVRVLSKLVKARFYDLIRDTGLLEELPRSAFEKDWNVDSRPVGSGVRALRYLSAYVFRTAISDKRIVSVGEDAVTFAYTDTRTGVDKLMSLKPFEFIRRFLQHVLPKGFMKIRYFGFLHPSSSIPLKLAVALLEAANDVHAAVDRTHAQPKTGAPFCPCCSGSGHVLFFSPPAARVHSGFT